jgi:hypothetical protein
MKKFMEEIALERIAKKAKKLEIPPPVLCFYEVEMEDINIKAPSKSFVRNFYNLMTHTSIYFYTGSTYGEGSTVLRNTSGSNGSTDRIYGLSSYLGGIGATSFGIVVGSGSNAVTFEDHKLQTQISHGTSSGQLSYQETVIENVWYDSGTFYCTLRRAFNNYSGGTVTVREIGLYASLSGSTSDYAMLARDVLGTAANIPHEKKLTVRYTFQCPFSS